MKLSKSGCNRMSIKEAALVSVIVAGSLVSLAGIVSIYSTYDTARDIADVNKDGITTNIEWKEAYERAGENNPETMSKTPFFQYEANARINQLYYEGRFK